MRIFWKKVVKSAAALANYACCCSTLSVYST